MKPTVAAETTVSPPASVDGHDIVRVTTLLPGVAPRLVWDRVTTPEGINAELAPFMTMTMPSSLHGLRIDDLPLHRPLGRAWVRLGGLLPVDYDDLQIADITPGERFLERSRTSTCRVWQHDRRVEEATGGTRLTDEVTFLMKSPLRPGRPILRRVVTALFRHRHARLRRQFAPAGTAAATSNP